MRGHQKQPELTGWQVHLGGIPVAIRAADPAWTGQDLRLLHELAGSFAYGFDAIRAVWEQAHETAAVTGYRIGLRAVPGGPAMSVDGVTVTGGVAEATLLISGQAFAEAAATDMRNAQTLMGDSVSDLARRAGIADEPADAIHRAWIISTPTFALSMRQARTARPELASSLELDAAFVSEAHRQVAKRVRAAGAAAGTYAGNEAKTLDRDVLAPAALELLEERLARHAAEDLVAFGMVQAEQATAGRERDVRSLEESSRLVLEWDPAERLAEVQWKHVVLRRCIEIVIELALRDQPHGQSPVDRLAWAELIAAAQTYLEATSRSEAVHHQIGPTVIKISDMYEIEAIEPTLGPAAPTTAGASQVYRLDAEAFRRARAIHDMDGDGDNTQGNDASHDGPEPARTRAQHLPGIPAEVDEAAQQVFGASASDIITVLFALGRWPLSETDADAAITNVTTIIQTLCELLELGSEPCGDSRIRSAVTLLMSRPADLQAADWRPWHARSRQRRLLVQPIAALRDDFAVIAPHFCLTSASVYLNYLTQGLLPWSSPDPPAPLDSALANLRDTRNRQLEIDVADTLRAAGYSYEVRIRETDPQRLGIPSLSGEIDAVTGRPGSKIIWLLEVKDPADVYATPEIRRHLDRFYKTRKKAKAYAELLAAKHQDLAQYADAVATALGLPVTQESAYEIRPIFVTRLPVPAAFTGGPFPFTTLKKLAPRLAAAEGNLPC
jgi:hypothetical protein